MAERAFIIFRQDEPGDHGGVPVAVYVGDNEACLRDMEHRQRINQNSLYYVLDKPLNPKSKRPIKGQSISAAEHSALTRVVVGQALRAGDREALAGLLRRAGGEAER